MNRLLLIYVLISSLLISCNQLEEGVDDEKVIVVDNPYGKHVITGYDIPFTAEDAAGNDITSNVTFYVDEVAQTSNEIHFTQTGSYQITAKMQLDGQEISSIPYQLEVNNPQNSTKILVEDYTGTWCVNCPRVVYHLEEAVNQNNHIIPVAIHQSTPIATDPFGFPDFDTLASDYNVSGLPTSIINRIKDPEGRWDEQYTSLQTYLNQSVPLGLKIESHNNGGKIAVEVSAQFSMDMNKQDLNLVLYLIENGLHADQENATSYYGGQNPIPDFEQKHVLRAALNGLYGTPFDTQDATAGNILSQQFEFDVPDNVTDINNCDIVAFIINNSNDQILVNIQKAGFGTTQDFD